VPIAMVAKVLDVGRLRVGYTNCRIRKWEKRKRCYKCLVLGHFAKECTGPDRSSLCHRGGNDDHKAVVCKSSRNKCEEFGIITKLRQAKPSMVEADQRILEERITSVNMTVRCMQINVDGGRVAQDLAEATAKHLGVDVLFICEQYRNKTEEGWFQDRNGRSAVVVLNPNIPILETSLANDLGFRWVTIGDICIYSCYWSPNTDFDRFEDFLSRLEKSIRGATVSVIVAGDFNAKSPVWGNPREDMKGQALVDRTSSLNLTTCNNGDRPTFVRIYRDGRLAQSHIDVTFVSEENSHTVLDWKVLGDYTGSLHQYITFNVMLSQVEPNHYSNGERWAWRKFNQTKLQEFLTSAEDSIIGKDVEAVRKKACLLVVTGYIANLRAICLAARRKYKRCRNNETLGQREIKHLEYKEARKKLKREIKKSKKASWDNLCNQVETDPWGLPYKIVTKKMMGRRAIPGLTLPGRLESIVDTSFPREAITKWPPRFSEQFFPEVNMAEVTEASSKIPLGKAPGPDGIPDM
ncbi:Uncharacterized protein FWK35_00036809, partial [Aphis craccivora]